MIFPRIHSEKLSVKAPAGSHPFFRKDSPVPVCRGKALTKILLFLPLFLFTLLLPAQQRTLSAYETARRQEAERRHAEAAEKAREIRNRYRLSGSRSKTPGESPLRKTTSSYRQSPPRQIGRNPNPATGKRTYTPSPAKRTYSPPRKNVPKAPPRKNLPAGNSSIRPGKPHQPSISAGKRKTPGTPSAAQGKVYPSPMVSPKSRVQLPPPPRKIAPVPPPPAAKRAKKIASARIGNSIYFSLRDIAAYYNMQLRFHKDGVEMFSYTGNKVRFYKKKRTGYINSILVHFLFPLYLRGNTGYFIHSEDVRVLLHPLLRKKNLLLPKSGRQKVILLDPGHGGSDTGALIPSLREKDMNLLMAWKVRNVLTSFGYKVYLTRSGDSTLSLEKRAELCKKIKPDLFISLHCNAAGDKKVRGIEVFAATPCNTASTGKTKPAHTKADPGNKFDADNFQLAYLVQRSLLSYTSAPDRGVRHARFLVIREASAPAILIEMGFLTNAEEVKNFRLSTYQNKMANGIAVGIHLYAKEKP